jgi:hypothetical protein
LSLLAVSRNPTYEVGRRWIIKMVNSVGKEVGVTGVALLAILYPDLHDGSFLYLKPAQKKMNTQEIEGKGISNLESVP